MGQREASRVFSYYSNRSGSPQPRRISARAWLRSFTAAFQSPVRALRDERRANGNGSAPRPRDFLAVAQDRAHATDRDGQERHADLRRDEEAAELERTEAGRAMKE